MPRRSGLRWFLISVFARSRNALCGLVQAGWQDSQDSSLPQRQERQKCSCWPDAAVDGLEGHLAIFLFRDTTSKLHRSRSPRIFPRRGQNCPDKDLCDKKRDDDEHMCYEKYGNGLRGGMFQTMLRAAWIMLFVGGMLVIEVSPSRALHG